jgi:sugar (pentulose or hexulose) kinase
MILSIDIGTTNLKVGLCTEEGKIIVRAMVSTPYDVRPDGRSVIDPERLWANIRSLIDQLIEKVPDVDITAVGITSMAESGLLVHRKTGKPMTGIVPWFDTSSIPQSQWIEREIDPLQQFFHTGLRISFKHGLSKLLWLKEKNGDLFLEPAVWLSVSSFIAYLLTGELREERTLAARTFVYRIDENRWDDALIRHFGFHPGLFPPVINCFEPVGRTKGDYGLPEGVRVYVAGHDHLVASIAAGALSPGVVYDSMGTAETLMGVLPKRPLTKKDYRSGLSFGLHHMEGCYFWMGGHSSSGGSVEWIRKIVGRKPISYEELLNELDKTGEIPSEVLFLPFLNGSGPPILDPSMKGAFLGLTKNTSRSDLLKSVLEGNAYQMEMIREQAESVSGQKIEKIIVVGGGTKNSHWLRIKANVSRCELIVPDIPEAGLAGAALIAATSEGVFSSLDEAARSRSNVTQTISPNEWLSGIYRNIYIDKYKRCLQILDYMK